MRVLKITSYGLNKRNYLKQNKTKEDRYEIAGSFNYQNNVAFPAFCNINKISFKGDIERNDKKIINYIFSELANPEQTGTIVDEIDSLTESQKKLFIKSFEEKTGFPDLKEVSRRIEKEAKRALLQTSEELGINVVMSNYNPTCSVGKGVALPGSDIDGWFIIIDGMEDDKKPFLKALQKNVNPLLLSIVKNKTTDYPPDIVPKSQFLEVIEESDKVFNSDPEFNSFQELEKFSKKLNTQYENWVEAGEFNIKIARYLPKEVRLPFLRAGIILENLREGTPFINSLNKQEIENIVSSALYKYSNSQQEHIYKTALKAKHLPRIKALESYSEMNLDEKFALIKSVIQIGYVAQRSNVREQEKSFFADHGCGNMDELMAKIKG